MHDPFFRIDRDKDRDDTDFDNRADYLEESAINILAGFKKELRLNGRIDVLDLEDSEITAMAIDAQLPFPKMLFDLAYKRAEEKLTGELSWD